MKKLYSIPLFAMVLCTFFSLQSSAQSWVQKGNDLDGDFPGDLQGGSLSISSDGNTLAVGARGFDGIGSNSGKVSIYTWNGLSWNLNYILDGEFGGDLNGFSLELSLDGTTLVVSGIKNDANGSNSGHVRVYAWNGAFWAQKGADIDGEAGNDWSGYSVSIDATGNSIAIGAVYNGGNGPSSGHTRIYTWNGSSWNQKGNDIDGEAAGDRSGYSVSLSSNGNTVAIGAPENGGNGSLSGHVRVYSWNGGSWVQKGIDIDGEAANDKSGTSVSLSSNGNTLAIGAPNNDGQGVNRGHARIYSWNGTLWVQKGGDLDGYLGGDAYGTSVSLSSNGDIVAIGGPFNDGPSSGSSSIGHTKIFEWNGSSWIQKGIDIYGESSGDRSGEAVCLSGNGETLVVGAPYNVGSMGFSAGHARVYTFCNLFVGTDNQTACNSYTWIDGNTYTSSNNTATHNIVGGAANGCDSIVTLNLTILNPASGIDAQTACSSYTWIDGNTYTNSNNTATHNILGGAANGCDSIVTLNLTILNPASGIDAQTACNSYTWIDGNTYTSSNNTATHTLSGAAISGCDSIITLDLTITTIDTGITVNGITISSNVNGASYQWLDCDNGMQQIPGAIAQSFTPTSNGNYAVAVSQNGCADSSSCIPVTAVGIFSAHKENPLVVYPNPTKGKVNIDLGTNKEHIYYQLFSSVGQLIEQGSFYNETNITLDIKGYPGVYFLKVNQQFIPLIKQ